MFIFYMGLFPVSRRVSEIQLALGRILVHSINNDLHIY